MRAGVRKVKHITGFLLLASLVGACLTINAQGRRDPWDYGNSDRGNRWDPSWNRRPFPPRGACFFTDRDYRGNRFCVRAGDRLPRLPSNFGDNISSIESFGGSRVIVFNDRDYRGGSEEFRGSVRDLRNRRFRDGHTWNNRISSIVVR